MDEVARPIGAGRARLEAMVRTGITAALEKRDLSQILFASDYGERVRERIRHRFVDRTLTFFTREPVGIAATVDPRLVAVLWQGSILMLVERLVSGELEITSTKPRGCARRGISGRSDSMVPLRGWRRARQSNTGCAPGNFPRAGLPATIRRMYDLRAAVRRTELLARALLPQQGIESGPAATFINADGVPSASCRRTGNRPRTRRSRSSSSRRSST